MPTLGGRRGSIARSSPLKVSWMRTSRTARRLAGPRLERGPAIGPAQLGFQLRRERQQRRLLPVPAHELDPDREAFTARAAGQRERRLAGEVPLGGERIGERLARERPQRAEPLPLSGPHWR